MKPGEIAACIAKLPRRLKHEISIATLDARRHRTTIEVELKIGKFKARELW
jgi:hypothetical protein